MCYIWSCNLLLSTHASLNDHPRCKHTPIFKSENVFAFVKLIFKRCKCGIFYMNTNIQLGQGYRFVCVFMLINIAWIRIHVIKNTVCIHLCTHTHTYIYTYIYIYICVCVCVCVCVWMDVYSLVCDNLDIVSFIYKKQKTKRQSPEETCK